MIYFVLFYFILFYFITDSDLNIYADENIVSYSHHDPQVLTHSVVRVTNRATNDVLKGSQTEIKPKF